MKLCLIAPKAPPYGGIANWTNIVQKQIVKTRSIEFSFINIAPIVGRFEKKSGLRYLITCCNQLRAQCKALIWQIKNNTPDVIHLTTSGRMSFVRDYMFVTIMKKYGIPCVYHIHFGRVPEIVEKKTIEYRIMSRIFPKVYKIIAIDPKTYICAKREFSLANLIYIPNPVEKCEVVEGKSKEKKEILYAGWIIRTKGVEELIRAWKNVRGRFRDYSLHLIGPYSNDYKDYLYKEYDMESVVMEGELTHEETLKRIQECSVLVLPSYTEGFPNIILEAMMAKKPIIATKVGAIPDMLDENSGVLIEPKQIRQIEDALCMLISNQSYQKQIATNAYQRATKLYETNVVFEQYMNVWSIKD